MPLEDLFIINQRYILAIMAFLAIINAYTMRVSFNVAFTEMTVKHTENKTVGVAICAKSAFDQDIDTIFFSNTNAQKFDFTEKQQGKILSSFFWGYTLTHIPAGIIADKFGGKWTLSIGLLITAIFSMLTPILAKTWEEKGLLVARACMGIGEGTSFPSVTVLISHWIPLKERSRVGAFIYGGTQVGAIFANALTGLLTSSYGWETVFYFWGSLAFIWFILFSLLCYSDPTTHPFIKDSEKEFLIESLSNIQRNKKLPPIPFRAMLKYSSGGLFALIVAQSGHNFAYYTMTTELPKYMADVMQFPVKKNGLAVALTFTMMWICSLIAGALSDFCITRGYISLLNARKLWTILSFIGPGIFMVLASYAGCNKTLVVVHFTICMAFMGVWFSGMKLTALDMSPNYAGTLMAFANGIGACMGVISPLIVAAVAPNSTLPQWRIVFWITFGISIFCAIVVKIFCTTEIQPWNDPDTMEK